MTLVTTVTVVTIVRVVTKDIAGMIVTNVTVVMRFVVMIYIHVW